MTTEPYDADSSERRGSRRATMTIADPYGRIRGLMDRAAEMDALRARNGQGPNFGSLPEMVAREISRQIDAAKENSRAKEAGF